MKPKRGDLLRYKVNGLLYICTDADNNYCKLMSFPDNQVFKIDHLEVVNREIKRNV